LKAPSLLPNVAQAPATSHPPHSPEMPSRSSTRSLRHEYQNYVEREVEDYKISVPTSVLHSIATEAARTLDEGAQIGMREVLLADEVDRIITAEAAHPVVRDLAPAAREERERAPQAGALGTSPRHAARARDPADPRHVALGARRRRARRGVGAVSRGERLRGDGDRARRSRW
jgi:hypothetical protein